MPSRPADPWKYEACKSCRYSLYSVRINADTKTIRVQCAGCGAVLFETQSKGTQ